MTLNLNKDCLITILFHLVLPLEPMRGGFIGLNFHYLPYGARFSFLQQLQSYASNGKFDQSTKIQSLHITQ